MAEAPYGPGARAGSLYVFLAGQIGLVLETGQLISGRVNEQPHQMIIDRIAVLHGAGPTLAHVARILVGPTDIDDWPAMNEI